MFPSVEHRSGYRDAVRPRVPPPTVPSGADGLDDLRRSMLDTTVVCNVLAVFGGVLLKAVLVRLAHAPFALVSAAAAAIALLWMTTRRERLHRANDSPDEVLITGQLVRSPCPPTPPSPEELARTLDPALDDFRRRFH